MTAAITTVAKAITFVAEEIVDFVMISKFGAVAATIATMAFFGFALPAIVSLFV